MNLARPRRLRLVLASGRHVQRRAAAGAVDECCVEQHGIIAVEQDPLSTARIRADFAQARLVGA